MTDWIGNVVDALVKYLNDSVRFRRPVRATTSNSPQRSSESTASPGHLRRPARARGAPSRCGVRVGAKRVARLMRRAGIEGVYRPRHRGRTRLNPDATSSGDLINQRFTIDAPDRLWVGDMTEHPTGVLGLAVGHRGS